MDQLCYDYVGSFASFDHIYLCGSVVPESMFTNKTEHNPGSGWNNNGFIENGDFGNGNPIQLNAGSNSADTLHELEVVASGGTAPVRGAFAVEDMFIGDNHFGSTIGEGFKVDYMKITFREN